MLTLNQIWVIVIAIFTLGLTVYTGSVDKALRTVHTARHYFFIFILFIIIVLIILYFANYYESSDHHSERAKHIRNVMFGYLLFAIFMLFISYWSLKSEKTMSNSRVARREVFMNTFDVFDAMRR